MTTLLWNNEGDFLTVRKSFPSVLCAKKLLFEKKRLFSQKNPALSAPTRRRSPFPLSPALGPPSGSSGTCPTAPRSSMRTIPPQACTTNYQHRAGEWLLAPRTPPRTGFSWNSAATPARTFIASWRKHEGRKHCARPRAADKVENAAVARPPPPRHALASIPMTRQNRPSQVQTRCWNGHQPVANGHQPVANEHQPVAAAWGWRVFQHTVSCLHASRPWANTDAGGAAQSPSMPTHGAERRHLGKILPVFEATPALTGARSPRPGTMYA